VGGCWEAGRLTFTKVLTARTQPVRPHPRHNDSATGWRVVWVDRLWCDNVCLLLLYVVLHSHTVTHSTPQLQSTHHTDTDSCCWTLYCILTLSHSQHLNYNQHITLIQTVKVTRSGCIWRQYGRVPSPTFNVCSWVPHKPVTLDCVWMYHCLYLASYLKVATSCPSQQILEANSDFLYGMATVKRDSQSAFTTTLTLPANGKPRLGEIQVKQSLPASAEIEVWLYIWVK